MERQRWSRLYYEYWIKYKGVSYLHLEWKAAAERKSINKSAKTLYHRFLRKQQTGVDDDLEDPEVDASFVTPQKIIDEDEHEVFVELTDKELVQWEKEQALEEEDEESTGDGEGINVNLVGEDVKIEGLEDEEQGDKGKEDSVEPTKDTVKVGEESDKQEGEYFHHLNV